MSVSLDQIVFDLAKKSNSTFTSIVYDSLCEQVTPLSMGFCELIFFSDIDLSSDVALFGLLLNSFLKQREVFPDPESSVPVVVPQEKFPRKVFGHRNASKPGTSKDNILLRVSSRDDLSSTVFPEKPASSLEGNHSPEVLWEDSDKSKITDSEVGKSVYIAYKELPAEKFKKVVLDSVERYCKQRTEELSSNYDRIMRQIQLSFKISLVFIIVGVAALLIGIISRLVFGYILSEMMINVGIFFEIAGVFAFYFQIDAKNRVRKYVDELDRLSRIRVAKFYVEQIKDTEKRNVSLNVLLASVLE